MRPGGETWHCGAFQPSAVPDRIGYRCTMDSGHTGDHRALIDGRLVAIWPQAHPAEA